jgi:hypothetical protein
MQGPTAPAWLDLYWLPLGAGGHFVRLNGKIYEHLVALREHRPPCDLYHAALQLRLDEMTYAIEVGPVWNVDTVDRGVVCQGPVGARWLGRFSAFQYEVRCWPGGHIPDIAEAVDSPQRLSESPQRVGAFLEVLGKVPTFTWGRDELGAGDMWNSNSVVAWALARTGLDMTTVRPPANGRAPGWTAGLSLARRHEARSGGACRTRATSARGA